MRGLPRLRAPGIVPCIISFFPGNSLVSSWCDHSMLASFLALKVSNSSLFSPALLRTHSLVFFAVHETRRIFLSPFISKASRRVSFFTTTTTTTNYLLRVLTRLRSVITLQHQFVGGGLDALLQHVEAKATRRQSPCSWVIPLFVRTIKADS